VFAVLSAAVFSAVLLSHSKDVLSLHNYFMWIKQEYLPKVRHFILPFVKITTLSISLQQNAYDIDIWAIQTKDVGGFLYGMLK
jgi:hypothetical protein